MSRPSHRRLRWTFLLAALLLLWSASAQDIVLDPRVFEIGSELRCPTCVAESVSESNAAIAREMRQIIQEQLLEGRSREEILAFFQQRYGDWVLLSPPRTGIFALIWIAPAVAALGGLLALALLMRRWRSVAEAPADIDPEDLARVHAALQSDDTTGSPHHRG
jgi:cytochrome c-type biogenesis protein CcmH